MSTQRTRTGLLAARAQLALARTGRTLLEQKRDALLRELYQEVWVIHAARDELDTAAARARAALETARVRHGDEVVAAAAAGALDEPAIEVRPASVMGVAVPAVTPRSLVRGVDDRGRAPMASGPALELAAQGFEEELTVAIRLATVEARVRRLAREIRRTSSRVNSLRNRVVPALEVETRMIRLALEQREREDHFRLKRVKSHRREGRPAADDRGPHGGDADRRGDRAAA